MNFYTRKIISAALILITLNCNSQTIVTIAGIGTAGFSGDNGPATSAQVNLPTSICRDIYGNIYIADRFNHRIRKIDYQTGYISTIAGTGTAGFSGDGGQATAAQLNQPIGIAVALDGVLYFSDNSNQRIRKIDTEGIITTVAGTGSAGYSGDGGQATLAKLNLPWGVALDHSGNIFIADRSNDRVRKIDKDGVITTVAGNGTTGYSGDGGIATNAQLNRPIAICLDTANNIFIADENNERLRKVTFIDGIISKIAGTGTAGYNGDGIAATSAQLNKPCGVAVDLAGNVYISDRVNQRLRKINTSGIISTIAGTGAIGYSGDGGNATSAKINYPRELFSDGSGNIYFADTDNNRIRKITYCSLPSIPVVAATSSVVCSSKSDTLSIVSGNLNDAVSWMWYKGSCGGEWIGSGNSVVVSPDVTTTYFARGEGGCVTPYACGSVTVSVMQIPAMPQSITGSSTVCQASVQSYSINEVAGATNYNWNLPAGWAGSSTSTVINTTVGSSGGNITVAANNACGTGEVQYLGVSVTQQVGSAVLTGNISPIPGSIEIYSATAADATSYIWDVPFGWLINSGQGTSELNVTVGETAGNICVTPSNSCGNGIKYCITVNLPTGSVDVDVASAFQVFPNPSGTYFNIIYSANHESVVSVRLYDVRGILIQSFLDKKLQQGRYAIMLEAAQLINGIYLLELVIDDQVNHSRVIIAK